MDLPLYLIQLDDDQYRCRLYTLVVLSQRSLFVIYCVQSLTEQHYFHIIQVTLINHIVNHIINHSLLTNERQRFSSLKIDFMYVIKKKKKLKHEPSTHDH